MHKCSFGLAGLLTLLSPALAFAQTGHAPRPLRERLLQTMQALVDAIPVGDKTVWQASLTADAIIVDEFGRVTGKAESVAALHPFPQGFSGSIALRNARVEQYGNTAIMLVEEYEQETVFGQKFVVRYQSLVTFVKQSDDWKVAGYEDVTLPTAPPKLAVAGLHLGDYQGHYRFGPGHVWQVSADQGVLRYTTHADGQAYVLEPIAKDVFMGSDDERNVYIFRRDAHGIVDALIERRKFNDLSLTKMRAETQASPTRLSPAVAGEGQH